MAKKGAGVVQMWSSLYLKPWGFLPSWIYGGGGGTRWGGTIPLCIKAHSQGCKGWNDVHSILFYEWIYEGVYWMQSRSSGEALKYPGGYPTEQRVGSELGASNFSSSFRS